MGKAAAKTKMTTTPAQYDIERSAAIFQARQQFVNAAVNMGWQLALTILVPVFIGVKLDAHFHAAPSYTLSALFIAIACAGAVVWNTLKQVAKSQAEKSQEKKSK